ncbi:MAG: ribosomal protein S18-alanine N-acetyltransferase [Eubacteriales bacterium]|nr:ribosomal protein S18-alanine N-acetyltransferase [Eubacteriales bacterium]
MTPWYVNQVCELERACFAHPWTLRDITDQLNSPFGLYYIAVEDGRVLGYVGSFMGADVVYINNVAVFAAVRRRGIATGLIEALKAGAREREATGLTLEVRSRNLPAIALYEKTGFQRAGFRKNYYTDPSDDAIIMNYELVY